MMTIIYAVLVLGVMGRLDQEEVQYNEKIRNYVHRSS